MLSFEELLASRWWLSFLGGCLFGIDGSYFLHPVGKFLFGLHLLTVEILARKIWSLLLKDDVGS